MPKKNCSWGVPRRAAGFILLLVWPLAGVRGAGWWAAPHVAAPPALRVADSLFARGQYAAAAPLYRQLVWRGGLASEQLLLRQAFGQHQLGHYAAEALYLNLALARTPRLGTWQQLVALAQRQRLVGYPATWQQTLRVQAQRYYYPGLQLLLSGAVVGGVGLGLRRRRADRGAWLAYGAYVLATAAYLGLLAPPPTAVVAQPRAALMAGPGAGANWLSTAAPGDRLPLLGRHDIWLRVRWQEGVAYVRATDVLVIE